MVTNMSAARPGSTCLEADVAALIAAQGVAEAAHIRDDLRHAPLRELPPEPGEVTVDVNYKPNPFATPDLADRYLRPSDSVVRLPVPRQSSWEQQAGYIAARSFRILSEAGMGALQNLQVFGPGDGLSPVKRAEMVNTCLLNQRPVAIIYPIDSITRFLLMDGDERYASVAIVARSLQHVAIAVAVGHTVAVGNHHTALIRRGGDVWIPASELPYSPVLHGSIAAPISIPGRGTPQAETLYPGCSNAVLLNGIVLGGIEAAYQPDCWPSDDAGMYIAAAAGRMVMSTFTGKLLTPHQVQAHLVNAVRKGKKVPGLIAARDELAARRLLTYLRRCGIA